MWIRKRSSGLQGQSNGAAGAELCDWCGRPLSEEFDEEAAACCESSGEFTNIQQPQQHQQQQRQRQRHQKEKLNEEDDEDDDNDRPTSRKEKRKQARQRPAVEEDEHLASSRPEAEAEAQETRTKPTPSAEGGDEKLCEMLRQIFAPTPDAILTPRQAFTRLVVAGWEEPHDELLLDRIGALFNTHSYFVRFKRGRFGLSDKAGLKRVEEDQQSRGNDEEKAYHQQNHHHQQQQQQHHRVESPGVEEDDEVQADGKDIICTSKNRNGWNCSQLAKPGSMLCEHHIALNRMRKVRGVGNQQQQQQQESDESFSPNNRKRVRSSRY